MTDDGFTLAADLVRPDSAPIRAGVLLAPAMGVRRQFYNRVASHFASNGIATLLVDYRGIGDSAPHRLRGFRATLRDWAERDLAAALASLREHVPGVPLVWLGHSLGGQLLGLLRDPPIARALFVASQSGHWRHWRGRGRVAMWALWHVVLPIVTPLAGRLPLRALRQGEDVPAQVALEWARWARRPDYILSVAHDRPEIAFNAMRAPIRSYVIADDAYAPRAAVEALLRGYRVAPTELRVVRPRDAGMRRIGHFGAFTPAAATLWQEWTQWIVG